MLFLSLDIVMNLITDTIHWGQVFPVTEEALSNQPGRHRRDHPTHSRHCRPHRLRRQHLPRRGIDGTLSARPVQRADARLWRAMVVNMAAFVAMITLRIVRIVRAARMDAVFDNANSFWDAPPLGPFYSTLWVLHIFLTALHYVKGVSALRRLAASEYHTHPDELSRIRRRVRNPYYSGVQMAPL